MRKTLKLILLSFLLIAALFIILTAPLGVKYYRNAMLYEHAMRTPITRPLIEVCINHKINATQKHDQPPLDQPIYLNEQVVAWVNAALPEIASLDYGRLDQQLLSDEKYFTPEGWCSYINALAEENIVGGLKTQKLDMRLITHGEPKVTKSLSIDGAYVWSIEVPISYTYKSDKAGEVTPPDTDDLLLSIQLSRSASDTNPDGIGIAKWVTTVR